MHADYEIADYFDMTDRQGRYYRTAAVSVGLVTNYRNNAELTTFGQEYVAATGVTRSELIRRGVGSNPFMRRVLELLRDSGSLTRGEILGYIRDESDVGGTTEGRRVTSVSNWLQGAGLAHAQDDVLVGNTPLIDQVLGTTLTTDLEELTPGQRGIVETHAPSIPDEEFDPSSIEDARETTLRRIALRKGQPQFRQALLSAYSGRCAMTGYDVVNALEAAHIIPYKGEGTNHPGNGLLLRADIHTLFDLKLIAVDTSNWTIVIAPSLQGTTYGYLAGLPVSIPNESGLQPSAAALDEHRISAGI